MSAKEASIFEEWGTKPLKEHPHIVSQSPNAQRQNETLPNKIQDHSPRRAKARSSSLYEEWKVQALVSAKENADPSVSMKKGSQKDKYVPSTDVAAVSEVGTSLQGGGGKGESVNNHVSPNQNGQTPANTSDRTVSKSAHRRACKSRNSSISNSHPHAEIPEVPQITEVHEVPVVPEVPEFPEAHETLEGGYTAPNGSFICKNELIKFSDGIKNENNDTVYFRPSFLENPWDGLEPIKTEFLRFY